MKTSVSHCFRRVSTLLSLGIFFVFLSAAVAQSTGQDARAVRLSYVDGKVQVAQGSEILADQALANTPLFEGSRITTGEDGRAEVQFEDGSVARIPPDSSITLTVLQPRGDTEVNLDSGMGYFELNGSNADNPMRVRFGSDIVTANGFTVLRIKLDQGPANVAVFSGDAHLEGSTGQVELRGGESAAVNDESTGYDIAESIEPDSWDTWNSDRDQALSTAEANSTPATSTLGDNGNPAWSELNQNGTWYDVPDEGYVWSPYVAASAGWDPYGLGYWMWTPRFGYMWVSGEPWGFMPYQCGAWNYYSSFGWGWAPGICQPWWGGGTSWYFNVPNPPKWYRLPRRPGPPRPRDPHPTQRVHAVGPAPVIPVNRREAPGKTVLPPRNPHTPVMIGGTVVRPLPVFPTRPRYNPPMQRPVTEPTVRAPIGVQARPGYVRAPQSGAAPGSTIRPEPRQSTGPTRPVFVPPPSTARPAPVAPRPAPRIEQAPALRPAPAPRVTPAPIPRSAPAPAPRPAPAPAPRSTPAGPHR